MAGPLSPPPSPVVNISTHRRSLPCPSSIWMRKNRIPSGQGENRTSQAHIRPSFPTHLHTPNAWIEDVSLASVSHEPARFLLPSHRQPPTKYHHLPCLPVPHKNKPKLNPCSNSHCMPTQLEILFAPEGRPSVTRSWQSSREDQGSAQ